MNANTRHRIEQVLAAKITGVHVVRGGDINEVYRVDFSDGRRALAKTNLAAPKGLFPAEAKGLSWLAAAQAIRVPSLYAVGSEESTGQAAFLLIEWLEPGRPAAQFDQKLGRQLAELHRFGAPHFGLNFDNFIGSLPQHNSPCDSWPEFYYSRRLEPQALLAVESGRLETAALRQFQKLQRKLPDLFSMPEAPARLHGDLWSGNLHVDVRGEPCLIDPAVYGGHREMDLGMMRLFGGFSSSVFDAYAEAFPLAPGFEERIAITQLYPLLVHLNLFGAGYAASVMNILRKYV